MQVLQAQAISQISTSNKSFRRHFGHIVRHALTRLAAAFDRRAHAEAVIVDRYVCHSWTDSTERQLIGDLTKAGF
jgi:hypothetical protein